MKKIIYAFFVMIFFSNQVFAQQVIAPGNNSEGSFYNFNINGETQTVSASSSSSSITFSLASSINAPDVLVTNAGSTPAFVGCGITTVTAQLPGSGNKQSLPVLAGETMVLRKGVGSDTCAAITSSLTTTIYFTAGSGN